MRRSNPCPTVRERKAADTLGAVELRKGIALGPEVHQTSRTVIKKKTEPRQTMGNVHDF